jgi:hypothetical protein
MTAPSTVTLADSGTYDVQSGDGVYSGAFTPTVAGNHVALLKTTGTSPEGVPFSRTAVSQFTVSAPLASFASIQSALLNNSATGMVGQLVVTANVNVSTVGSYRFYITLLAANGKTIEASNSAVLAHGAQPITASFSASDLYSLGVSGPYQLQNARLFYEGPFGEILASSMAQAGSTTALQMSAVDRGPLYFTGQNAVTQLASGGSNQPSTLQVLVGAYAPGGYCAWNAALKDSNGNVIDMVSTSSDTVQAGNTSLELDFSGTKIGQANNNGSLVVDQVGVHCSGADIYANPLLQTQTFTSSQFTVSLNGPVSLSTTAASVSTGGSTAVQVAYVGSDSASAITLSVSGLPAGVSAQFDNPQLPVNGAATLTINAGTTAVPGTYSIPIQAIGPSVNQTLALSISVAPGGATASYVGSDASRQGNWSGKYGVDGQLIPNDLTNVPSYAVVSLSGASTWTWASSATDVRALQESSGSFSRIASTYYSSTVFTIDVNLTDGKAHRLSLYLCDWEPNGRVETISIIDATSNAVLDTKGFSSFGNGVYETWSIKGHVQIQVTYNSGVNGIVNGLFFDTTASTTSGSTASYVGSDTAVQGNWTGKYGADGQLIPNDLTNLPAYANVSLTGASTWTWASATSDARVLQASSGSSARLASTYYGPTVFAIDVNLTDGNVHKISLYLCDWDLNGRAETISIVDAASNAVLDTRAISSFGSGIYESWSVKGHVQIQVTNNAGVNGIVNAIFFDTDAAASYLGADTATQGNWTGNYGADGQLVANGLMNAPSYAGVNLTGANTWTWATATTDVRALRTSTGSSSRFASTYYAASVFTIDVNITDSNPHKISLYLCDWELNGRAETISIVSATSKAVLDTRAFSSFGGGIYETWSIKGHVQIQVAYSAGVNGIVNAIFFN